MDFWFGSSTDEAPSDDRLKRWFAGGEELDRVIREGFSEDVEQARSGARREWAETARGRLALIVLIDQFSRNLYRGAAAAFSKDALALELALAGLDNGHYDQLTPFEQLFFILPLEHAEDLAMQDRAVALYEAWADALPDGLGDLGQSVLGFARMHRDVIARFGRFPTRNEAIGRPSTPEEEMHVRGAKAAGHPV